MISNCLNLLLKSCFFIWSLVLDRYCFSTVFDCCSDICHQQQQLLFLSKTDLSASLVCSWSTPSSLWLTCFQIRAFYQFLALFAVNNYFWTLFRKVHLEIVEPNQNRPLRWPSLQIPYWSFLIAFDHFRQ